MYLSRSSSSTQNLYLLHGELRFSNSAECQAKFSIILHVPYGTSGLLTIHTSPAQSAMKKQQLVLQSLGMESGVRGLRERLQEKLFRAQLRQSADFALGI